MPGVLLPILARAADLPVRWRIIAGRAPSGPRPLRRSPILASAGQPVDGPRPNCHKPCVNDEVTAVVTNIDRKNRSIQLSVKAKDAADQQEALASLNQDAGHAGTTSLGALLRAKLDSDKS